MYDDFRARQRAELEEAEAQRMTPCAEQAEEAERDGETDDGE